MSDPFERPPVFGATDTHTVSPSAISAFLPILVLGLVMLAWFFFLASQLRAERDAMREVIASQEKPIQDSRKLRDSLDAIARGTAQLAEAGNPNARVIVDELKKRGITISPNQPTTATGVDTTPAPTK